MLEAEGKISEAISHYEEAIRLQPNFGKAHLELGAALGRKGDKAGAVTEFRAAEADPNPQIRERAAAELAADGTPETHAERESDLARLSRLTRDLPDRERELIALKYGATLDKYVGDAIMAVFGLPFAAENDVHNSVQAACDMLQVLELLNARRAAAGSGIIRIGVGIATGTVIDGNIGSPRRMDFTVIGDAVNLASRIESMTKLYGADILICAETRKRLAGTPKMRRIDVVRVRGQTRPTNIFEVLEHRAAVWTPALDEAIATYEAGLDAYLAGDWTTAQERFEVSLRLRGEDKAVPITCRWSLRRMTARAASSSATAPEALCLML